MESFELDLGIVRQIAERLASREYGQVDGIERRMLIDGIELYAHAYEQNGFDIAGMEEMLVPGCASAGQLHAMIAYAAYVHYVGDRDWAWEHFADRSELCDVEGCRSFAKECADKALRIRP